MENIKNFDNMGLDIHILKGIYGYGFEKPSEIQYKAIPEICNGRDVIAQAQSGTGKTGAFVISSLQRINKNLKKPQILTVVPTHELALQIHDVYKSLGSYTNYVSTTVIGGTDIRQTVEQLKNTQIIVGTPGRINDLICKRIVKTDDISMFIMDEADEMLSSSFKEQIKKIFSYIPQNAQVCMFSATMPSAIIELTSMFMKDPIKILIKNEMLTLDGIKQYYIQMDKEEWKFETFCDIYASITIGQSIVYVNTKKRAMWLANRLNEQKFTVALIHSELNSVMRNKIMSSFRKGESRILISTNLLARGIDVQQVSVVVNYDIPRDRESYIHRIGRSGRYGRKGAAINFVVGEDINSIKAIEEYYATNIEELPEDIEQIIMS